MLLFCSWFNQLDSNSLPLNSFGDGAGKSRVKHACKAVVLPHHHRRKIPDPRLKALSYDFQLSTVHSEPYFPVGNEIDPSFFMAKADWLNYSACMDLCFL
jgi:hypothetical protein